MDKNQLRRLIEEATKSLTPSRVKVDVLSDDSLRVSIIAEAFNGMPLTKRFSALRELLEASASEITKKYFLVFDALSKTEADTQEAAEVANNSSVQRGKNQAAAQPSQ
jgi:hypothetical protein